MALPVRERRQVREAFPGRLHLRGHRPDARLVLHAARDRDAGFRQRRLQELHLPEPDRRQRRQEDVEVGRQHRQSLRRVRHGRRRCAALVFPCAPVARRAEAYLGRNRRRRRQFVHQHVLEHLRLLRAVRAARRGRPDAHVPVEDRPEIDRWALALLHKTITT